MWNGTIFVDLDWPLNASSLLSASAELLVTCRIPWSGKLPVLNLLTGQKLGFRPAGATRCTDSRQTWQGRRAQGSAWLCKIFPLSPQGGCSPKISKNSTFWQRVAPQGRLPWPISEIFRGFYVPNYLTWVFRIWLDSLQCVSGQKVSIFAPVGKTMRWIEKWLPPSIVLTSSMILQSLGRLSYARRLWERKYGVFVCLAWSACVWGYSLKKHCVTVYGWILMQFSALFQKKVHFQMH